jgi:hypothetical protein
MTLEQARDKADGLRKQLASGIDPLSEKQRQANEDKAQKAKFMTFNNVLMLTSTPTKPDGKIPSIFNSGKTRCHSTSSQCSELWTLRPLILD